MKKFKRHRDYWFSDQDIRLSKLSQLGDPLEKLKNGIDFEMFRDLLEGKFTGPPKAEADVLLMTTCFFLRFSSYSDIITAAADRLSDEQPGRRNDRIPDQ